MVWSWWVNWRKRSGPDLPRDKPDAAAVGNADVDREFAGATGDELGLELIPMVTTDLYHLTKVGTVNVVDLTLPHTLDIQEFDRLNESILALVRREPEGQWVLDLSRLSYMGSAALGLMVNLRQQIKQSGGRLVLCGLSPQLLHIFKTCCMERLFKITKSRADALAAAQ